MESESSIQFIAPLSGPVIAIEQVPDLVFSQRLVGDGIAIDPCSSVLLSPVDGHIKTLHPCHHAVTVAGKNDLEILMHIGLETVHLKGKGFTPKVAVGDFVRRGQPLIEYDLDFLAKNCKSLISPIVITDANAHIQPTKKKYVIAGHDVAFDAKMLRRSADEISGSKAQSAEFKIRLTAGLHARPAALLVSRAKTFQSHIELCKANETANAKSVVSLLGLNISSKDSICLRANGPDSSTAVQSLYTFLTELTESDPHSAAPSKKIVDSTSRDISGQTLSGVSASPGVAVGVVHQLRSEILQYKEQGQGLDIERQRLARGLKAAAADLLQLNSQLAQDVSMPQAAIFLAHLELIEDPDLIELATTQMNAGRSAEAAWHYATQLHADRLGGLNNELMANRANDLKDIGLRVLRHLVPNSRPVVEHFTGPTILIAENLTPSETANFRKSEICGFCTTTGGATSHVAILARSLGIPALAGLDQRALNIPNGTQVVLDGDNGHLRLNPSISEIKIFSEQQSLAEQQRSVALQHADQAAETKDHRRIEVAANIGSAAEAREAVKMGCDGVGLLRSEFLFLGRTDQPSEQEQHQVYQEIADILGPRPLIIRTLDVGGDKPLQYLPLPHEDNPFLGLRGIRVGLKYQQIFREQLRAILRVRSQGRLHIMFPMIAQIEELRQAKMILEEERQRFNVPPVSVGIMIEVPSAALMAETFAKEVDFFSIGTNDLTQYTLAMDRGHDALAKQVDSLHPSVLNLIYLTVQAAHRHKKWVGICGGIASDAQAISVLLGLGIDELSVSIPAIASVKAQIRHLRFDQTQALAQKALLAQSAKEVRDLKDDELH